MPETPSTGHLPTLRLFLAAGAVELRAITLVSNMLTIGRRPYNDLQLDDLTVSGEHALLRVRAGGVSIHDLDSRNGTLVNGLAVKQRDLVDGDIVDIGIYRLRFEAARAAGSEPAAEALPVPGAASVPEATGAASEQPGDRHGAPGRPAASARVAAPGGPPPSGEPAVPAAAAVDGEVAPPAHLVCLSGAQAGQMQPLDRSINRVAGSVGQVAVISRRKGGYFITHLEGLTFPLVNGEPIGLTAHRLNDSDLIELAGTMLRFRLDS